MAQSSNPGSFVPTTNIWDVGDINSLKNVSPELKELLVRLYQNLNRMSLALNTKDSGFYVLNEFVNGQVYFTNPNLSSTAHQSTLPRQVVRTVVNFGALPAAGVKTMPHGIVPNSSFTFTRIYGCASDPIDKIYVPLPYSSPVLVGNIELSVDATDVIVTVGADWSAYTVTYIILEYLKS